MSAELQLVDGALVDDAQPSIIASNRIRSCAMPVTPMREKVTTIVAIAAAAVTVWFLANQEARITNMNYNIDHLQTQVQSMNVHNAWMAAEVDKLKEPNRILGIALNELHMQYAPAVPLNAQPTTGH